MNRHLEENQKYHRAYKSLLDVEFFTESRSGSLLDQELAEAPQFFQIAEE